MVKGISVVIPNFNGIKLFPFTLPTVLKALETSGKPSEIIIVDDCSTDGSVAYLNQHYPFIETIVNSTNSGFSVSSNAGFRAAKYDKVLLLNSDVQLTPGYFLSQYKYFDMPDSFGVMGRIIGWDDDLIQDGAKYPLFQGAKIKTSANYLLKDTDAMADGLFTMYLSGANAFIDKEKFIKLGGFDELFSPFYVEDFEISARAWRLGFKCYYDHSSICKHKTSTTIATERRKKSIEIIYNRNKMFLHAIHLEGAQKAVWVVQLFFETFLKAIFFKIAYLRSVLLFLKASKEVKRSRKRFLAISAASGVRKNIWQVAQFILESVAGKEKIMFQS
jgi:GT2 family glycosyltransferase